MKGNMLGRVGGSKTGLLASSIGSPTGYDGTRSAKDSPARSLSDPLLLRSMLLSLLVGMLGPLQWVIPGGKQPGMLA